ncbi:hypothetical protein TNIN_457631 [Trichonephila inaurata madagascariensis]|uniref:Uncharacterized protein n=1 Tax=Trichonephila inaurata madagascariensis TaxID=2747483 RepID=A0A8X6X6R2_9ARAC|nr:hypothetical protein TNIN_457631 [Trichonephila inaurata madagascariensis]
MDMSASRDVAPSIAEAEESCPPCSLERTPVEETGMLGSAPQTTPPPTLYGTLSLFWEEGKRQPRRAGEEKRRNENRSRR